MLSLSLGARVTVQCSGLERGLQPVSWVNSLRNQATVPFNGLKPTLQTGALHSNSCKAASGNLNFARFPAPPMNPILALELRARWRNNRSFLLLLLVGLALMLLGLLFYIAAISGSEQDMAGRVRSGNAQANAIGRTLFTLLANVNIAAWLFIAAASAAPAIARERERGLLESLQLSHVSAWGQIGARLLANLALLGVLQLVLTPGYALAFLMGGVSPLEVGAAFYLVACSAILGSAFGLWFSARAHRPTGALFSALGLMAAWSAAVYVYSLGGNTNYFNGWHLVHPSAFFAAFSDPNFGWTMQWGGSPLLCLLAVSAIWAALCAALLWSAARNVARTLPTAAWREGSAWVEKLRRKQAASVSRASQSRAPQSRARQKASGALLTEVPLDRFVNFANPLLAREVKGRFRLRRVGWGLSLVRGALFVGVCLVWLAELYWLLDEQWRATMVPYALLMLLVVGMACVGVIAATSWTRERESGTWEALQLSLLRPRRNRARQMALAARLVRLLLGAAVAVVAHRRALFRPDNFAVGRAHCGGMVGRGGRAGPVDFVARA